jgi:Uma2 family endonuclease
MSAVPRTQISREEYLRIERAATSRSEFHEGQIVALAGAGRNHNKIVSNLVAAIGNGLREQDCSVYASDFRVSIAGGKRYVYPDVLVTCGQEIFEDDQQDNLVNPMVILEVLSASTEGYDRGEKFLLYQAIPSLREYFLVSQVTRRFEVFRKQADGNWLYQAQEPAETPFIASCNLSIKADEVYFKTDSSPSLPFDKG